MNTLSQSPALLVYAAIGFGFGLLYFRGLWWNVCQFAGGCRAVTLIFLAISRFLLLCAALLVVSYAGALPLLAAALGIVAARAAALHHVCRLTP